MDFTVKKLSPDDINIAKQLILFFQEDDGVASPIIPSNAYLEELLAKESFHIVVAMRDELLIGGATAYELDMYKKSVREMFLYEIAVKHAHRQKGVGATLIGKLKQLCSERGIDEMYVGTTTPNQAAMKLYSSTGGELVADIAWFVYQLEKQMKYVLGIDIGTGSTKALAVDLTGKPFADHQAYYPFSSPKPGYHEQDPEKIWGALTASVKGLTDKVGEDPLTVGLSSAMHSLIAVDTECNALAPMMTWADNRSYEIAKKLRGTEDGMAIYRATGTPLHAMSPLCKIVWLKENEPALFVKAYKFISIKEYIWYRLFGEFAIDHSLASGTGLFDITALKWHPASLAFAGISEKQLSLPEPTSYSKPYTNGDVFKTGTPINISGSDGCLANLGSMADKPGIAALTIGTSGAVRAASPRPLPNDAAMTFSYILDEKTYICGGPVNNGGIAMQWWVKNFSGVDLSEREYDSVFQDAANVPAGSGGLIFLPYLSGERAPIWDSESCGNFFGVKLAHTRAHFSRAVLEGICFALKDVLVAVEENSGPASQINISGGFTRSEVWVQILADITGKPLAIVQSDDASALGAALTAMKANGLMDEYPSISGSTRLFKPNLENTAVYSKYFEVFKKLYNDLKSTMHKTAMQAN